MYVQDLYGNSYSGYSGDMVDAALGTINAVASVLFVVSLISILVSAIAQCNLFYKAGKPGWFALIPFCNNYARAQIALGDRYGIVGIVLVICSMIPMVNIISWVGTWYIMGCYGRTYGKPFIFGIIASVFPFLWIFATGRSSPYLGPVPGNLVDSIFGGHSTDPGTTGTGNYDGNYGGNYNGNYGGNYNGNYSGNYNSGNYGTNDSGQRAYGLDELFNQQSQNGSTGYGFGFDQPQRNYGHDNGDGTRYDTSKNYGENDVRN